METLISTPAAMPIWSAPERSALPQSDPVRLGVVVSALSHALDLSTGQPVGHSIRSCVIGMRLAAEVQLTERVKNDLYYALLLKDCGCSSNASKMYHALAGDELKAKRNSKTTDWTRMSAETLWYALSHVAPGKPFLERTRALFRLAVNQKQHARDVITIRCQRGATLAHLMGLSNSTADGIASLDEHWDGRGQPENLVRWDIPIFSRIMLLAQTLEVFWSSQGAQAAIDVAQQRSGHWFDPELVKAARSLASSGKLWDRLDGDSVFEAVLDCEPVHRTMEESETKFDSIALAFGQIVDAKSPFTFNHSNGVANASVAIAQKMGFSPDRVIFLRHAALLHDLGKLGVSNAILEKPGKLDESEWQSMRLHPFYTWKILRAIPGFHQMSEIAASHHEKLNGTGYFRGLKAPDLSVEARILAVADVFDALSAKRPYRDALPPEKVFSILRKDVPHALDADCVQALDESGIISDQSFINLHTLKSQLH